VIRPHQAALWLAVALVSTPVQASPLFELYGATDAVGGLNARAGGASAASTYYNPALLPRAKRGLHAGSFIGHDAISIDVWRRSAGNDLSTAGIGKYRGGEQTALPTRWLERGCTPADGACVSPFAARPRQGVDSSHETRPYATVGMVAPLIGKYLTAGMYTMLPLEVFTSARSFYVDEREQFFSNSLHPELYADRLDSLSLALGLGSQLSDKLALGLSLSLSMKNEAAAPTYVSDSSQFDTSLRITTDVDVKLRFAPNFALALTPTPRLTLSATLHAPQKLAITTRPSATLPVGEVQSATRESVHGFLPWRAALGLSWTLIDESERSWSITGHALFGRWSRYQNRQGERAHHDFAWRDTVSGAIGVRNRRSGLHTGLDVTYVPTPTPEQVGRESYVDNSRLGVALGTEYVFPPLGQLTCKLGVAAQLHFLFARLHAKLDPTAHPPVYPQLVRDEWADGQVDTSTGEVYQDSIGLQTNNPGWPGFSSRGYLVAGGLNLTVLY
jgi:long-chain fatty acid transport protein